MAIKRKKLAWAVLGTLFCVSSPTGAKNSLDVVFRDPMPSVVSVPQPPRQIYNINLAEPNTYWGTVLSNDRASFVPGRGVVSHGPFYIDTNHREGALLVGPLVMWVNGHRVAGETHVPRGNMDLRNTTIRFDLKLQHQAVENEFDFTVGGKVVFWFQAKLDREAVAGGDYQMPTRVANYVHVRNLLDPARRGEKTEIKVTPDLNQWSCLGSNPIDLRPLIGSAAKYTCALDQAEFEDAMAHPANMGFLILLPPKAPDGAKLTWLNSRNPVRTLAMPSTALELREFSISRDDELNIGSRDLSLAVAARP